MPSLTLDIRFGGDLHRRILTAVRDRVQVSKRDLGTRHTKWAQAEERALAFLPERDIDAKRRVERDSKGKPQYVTIQIPYTYAVIMSMHTYWTTVFMGRDPVLQFTGRHGETQQNVQALEALMAYNVQVGRMLVPFYIWLMDVAKYGLGITGLFWDEEFAVVSEIVEREVKFLGFIKSNKTKKTKISQRLRTYEGNRVYNIRPFDFFPDTRLPISKFQEGEYCAVYGEMGWNTVLRREDLGYYTNIEHLRTGGGGTTGERVEGSAQLEIPTATESFLIGDGGRRKGSEVIKYYECVIDLVPKRWGLGRSTFPEKWVFTVTHDFRVVFGAQPLGANHNKFPYSVIELEPEGYSLAPRGMPEIVQSVQNTVDWLINSHFYNVRKTLNNQFVVDPSRVVMKDFMEGIAGGIIRLKPAAYGTDPKLVFAQVPVVDVTAGHMKDVELMLQFGQRVSGVSDQIMGMVNTKGRQTAQEIRTSSTFGINRLKTSSEYFSAMGWSPLSQMMLQNAQQFYDSDQKFRIVGDLALSANKSFTDVTPEAIAGFYDYVPVDGTLPIDRFAQANLWRALFSELRTMPELLQRYDIGRIFEWVASLAGLKNISQFRIDVQPDEVLEDRAQRGDVVPLPTKRGPQDLGRVPESGQVGGLGTSG